MSNEDSQPPLTPPPTSPTPPPLAPLVDNSTDWNQDDSNDLIDDDIDGNDNGSTTNSNENATLEDDPIASLTYLQKFGASSNVSERQNAVRNIVKTLQNVEHDETATQIVFNLVKKTFADDLDAVVRGELLEQLPMICMHCSQSPALNRYASEVLYPLLVKFLNDPNTQVRKTCQAAILILIEQGLLIADDIIEFIYPELIRLSSTIFPDDVRIEAVALLCKLVSTLGRDRTIKLLLTRFTELCEDPLFHVRKTCASHLGEMSRVLGQDVTEKLLVPHLISLSQDSVWGVRKTCAECFTDISYNCAMQTRRHQLAPVFIVLLADNSRWVQCSAFQALGPFISTFADSTRTGLRWVDGELVYDEQRLESFNDHSNVAYDRNEEKSPSGEIDDDTMQNLSSLLDESTPNSSAITSNIAQLAKQRLNGDINRAATCIIDLTDALGQTDNQISVSEDAPLTSESISETPDKENLSSEQKSPTPSDEFESEFNSFNFWKPNFQFDDLDVGETAPVAAAVGARKSGNSKRESGDEDSNEMDRENQNFREKFMEKRLGVVTTGSDVVGETSPTVGMSEKEPVNESIDEPNSKNQGYQMKRRDPAEEYISFVTSDRRSGFSTSSADVSPKNFEYQDIIPQALLDQFLSMVEPSRAQSIESDISRHCAFNLPAVAFTIGRRHWPLIKPTYLQLANDMQWKVRRTLAFSIHELAAILGHEATVQDLLPVFTGFLRDLDEVRIGILKHLYDFLKLLEKDVRRTLLPHLHDFLQTDNVRSWRFRHLFAEQLISLCELFDIEDINEYLSPIAMTLAVDRISEIRHITHRLLATIVRCFYKTESIRGGDKCYITDSFIHDIVKAFAMSQKWVRRQTFVYICREIVRIYAVSESKFAMELLPHLINLSADPIPNVRIGLAALFSEVSYSKTGEISFLNDSELVKQVESQLKLFSNDRDRDVRLHSHGLADLKKVYNPAMWDILQDYYEEEQNRELI